MTRAAALIEAARALHQAVPEVGAFCEFPDDLGPGTAQPFCHPVMELFAAETGLGGGPFQEFVKAIYGVRDMAEWRETYKGTALFDQIMHRFGCFEIIGYDAFASSRKMRSFMVYMPAGFHYPLHQHPAEELYVVLAGEAVFVAEGREPELVQPGGTVFHAANQPHATTTLDKPVLCYVLWHDEFDSPPVWSEA